MSVSATFTMLVSMISSSAPIATATATSHLLTFAGATEIAACPAIGNVDAALMASTVVGVDVQLDAHARAQQHTVRHGVHAHAHRDALHDLGEVAGRVVGRQQREARAGRTR